MPAQKKKKSNNQMNSQKTTILTVAVLLLVLILGYQLVSIRQDSRANLGLSDAVAYNGPQTAQQKTIENSLEYRDLNEILGDVNYLAQQATLTAVTQVDGSNTAKFYSGSGFANYFNSGNYVAVKTELSSFELDFNLDTQTLSYDVSDLVIDQDKNKVLGATSEVRIKQVTVLMNNNEVSVKLPFDVMEQIVNDDVVRLQATTTVNMDDNPELRDVLGMQEVDASEVTLTFMVDLLEEAQALNVME